MAYYFSPFRKVYHKPPDLSADSKVCPFCNVEKRERQAVRNKEGKIIENSHYIWMVNFFPKFEGHTMVLPKRHLMRLEDESAEEILARQKMMLVATKVLGKLYPGAGMEIFIQYGPGSEQTVAHLHWHVVPAQPDDPLRGFEKMGHFYTDEKGKEKQIIFPIAIEKAKQELQAALSKLA